MLGDVIRGLHCPHWLSCFLTSVGKLAEGPDHAPMPPSTICAALSYQTVRQKSGRTGPRTQREFGPVVWGSQGNACGSVPMAHVLARVMILEKGCSA